MASSLVNNKYRITRRIGGGSFGEIYMGIGPNNEKVAVKFERHGTRCPQLRHEYKVYRELINCHGFCNVYHFGTQDNYNVMVMDLLGPSLEDLFNKCNRRFTLKTVLQIADQLLERVDTLHARHLIHRDIKPANFVIGVGEAGANVFCVDFGLSKRYRHPKNLQHIPHRDGRSLTGTPRYASINNHLGIEQSRRDDLESIGYVLIYFLKGTLPWQGLKAKNAQKKYRLILEKKQQVSIAQLCQGCPSQFAEFLAYTRSLKFDAKPDIPYLRKLFRDLYHAQGCASVPKLWDWDGIDADYLSGTGSVGGGGPVGGPAPITLGAQQLGGQALRPTTAAAVAAPSNMDHDLGGVNDDLDDDYDRRNAPHDGRPNTAGPTMSAAYNRQQPQQQPQVSTTSWGYSRGGVEQQQQQPVGARGVSAGVGGTGIADYGADAQNRRPHTAHGARAGFPAATTGYVDPKLQQQQNNQQVLYDGQEGEDGDHVVAGARGMMRYRRNRATTLESAGGTPIQQPPVANGQQQMQQQQYGAGGYMGAPQLQQQQSGTNLGGAQQNATTPWATYNAGGKPTSSLPQQQMQNTQHMSLRKTGAPSGAPQQQGMGWPGFSSNGQADPSAANSRPKSAGITGTTGNVGGLMSSLTGAGRPSSGGAANNWGPVGGVAPQQGQQQQQQMAGAQNSSNTLSYGSLKNRFLSGSAGGATGAPKANGAAPNPSAVGGSGMSGGGSGTGSGNKSSSKLFSLAR